MPLYGRLRSPGSAALRSRFWIVDDVGMEQSANEDAGTHEVALRGPTGDIGGQLSVSRSAQLWTVVPTADGRTWHSGGGDLFSALRDLRVGPDGDNFVIGLNGARPECVVSGVLADMGEGRKAHVLTLPRVEKRPERVRTLGPAPLDDVADVVTQDEYKRRWHG